MKEVTQRLSNTPAVAAQGGKLESTPVITPQLGQVTLEKSKGERLAEAMGMGVQLTGKIVEEVNKQKDVFNIISASKQATDFSNAAIQEAEDQQMDDEAKLKFYEGKMNEYMGTLQTRPIVSAASFETGIKTVTSKLAAAQEKVFEKQRADITANIKEGFNTAIQNAMITGGTLTMPGKDGKPKTITNPTNDDVLEFLRSSGLNNAEVGKTYIGATIAHIQRDLGDAIRSGQPINVTNFQNIINTRLKIKTKDGIDYSTHPEYQPKIAALETQLQTAAKAQANSNRLATYVTFDTAISQLGPADLDKQAGLTEQIITAAKQGLITKDEYDGLTKKLKGVFTGEGVKDNYTTFQAAMDIVTTKRLKKNQLTADWFVKHGIYDTENRTKLINMAETVEKVNTNEHVSTYASLLRNAYKKDPLKYDPEWDAKVNGALEYFHKLVLTGITPDVAYEKAKKEFGITSAYTPSVESVKGSKFVDTKKETTPGMNIGNDVLLNLIKQYEINHK